MPALCLWLVSGIGNPAVNAQADGSQKWVFSAGGVVESSPAVTADGTVLVGAHNRSAGRLLAIQPNGDLKWQFETADWIDSSPSIAADGTIYVGCWDGKLYALTATGVKKWEFDTRTFVYSSPAIAEDGTLYFGSGANALHALRPDGTEKWRMTVGDWVDTSPAIGADGTVYFGSWDHFIYAVGSDGVEKWRHDTGAPVFSSPAIGRDGTIYIGTTNQRLLAISASGGILWEFNPGGSIQASPAVGADGTIYFGSSDWYFYAVNPDGTLKWRHLVGQSIVSTAAIRSDGTIIFGADDRRVRALNPDGTLKWSLDTGDRIESSPAVASDGTIYIGGRDNRLYSINGSGAPASGYASWPVFHGGIRHGGRTYSESTAGRLVNLSTRGRGNHERNLIMGFVVQGRSARRFLLRAVGPTLGTLGVSEPLADPKLALWVLPSGFTLYLNDNWGDEDEAEFTAQTAAGVGAFPLPEGSRDSAFITNLPAGSYGAVVGSADSEAGVVLAEVYDVLTELNSSRALATTTRTASLSGLVNLSTRGQVGLGADILISGLVIGPGSPRRVLVRAVGPGLEQFGVTGVLANPQLDVYSGSTLLQRNTGWSTGRNVSDLRAVESDVWAFPLAIGSTDCAMLITLPSGNYTLQVSGRGGTVGEALIEIYVTP